MIKRPVFISVLVIILGEIIALMTENICWMFLLAIVLVILKVITKKQGALFVVIFLFCGIGFLNMNRGIMQKEQMEIICENKEKTECVARGRLTEIVESSYGYNLILSDVSVNQIWQDKLLVSVKEKPNVKIGQTVYARGNLSLISGAKNFGNFDGKNYYRSLEIYGRLSASSLLATGKGDFIRQRIFQEKEKFRENLKRICPGSARIYVGKAEIYEAMLLGERAEMAEEIKELYSTSGIAHILAISSLHISLTGLLAYQLLRKKFRFVVSASVSLALVISFGLLSGMSVATVRAIIMFGLKLFGEILGRKYDVLTAISLSALLLLLDNPFVIFNGGFQMSFIAIIGIVPVWNLLMECMELKNKFLKTVISAMNIHIIMVPVIAYQYFEIPTYSILLNLVVVPMMSIVIVSGLAGMLIGSFSILLGKILILPGCICLSFFTKMCETTKGLPGANVIVGKPEIWKIILYYSVFIGGLFLINHIKGKVEKIHKERKIKVPEGGIDLRKEREEELKVKKLFRQLKVAVGLIVLGLQLLIYIKIPSEFYVSFLDVGQGDGIVIHTKEGINITVDGGSTSVDEVGKRRIIPFLKAKGISRIDYAVMTHGDLDHISGLMELIEQSDENGVEVQCLVLPQIGNADEAYLSLVQLAKENQVEVKYISQGDRWNIGEMSISCIYPKSGETSENRNDLSTVLSVTYEKFSMILTGDISAEVENKLEGLLEKYTLLKVAHHGSNYSSSTTFLNKISPDIAVISVGESNWYGHPGAETLKRLGECGSEVIRTDESGGITVRVHGNQLEIEKYLKESG